MIITAEPYSIVSQLTALELEVVQCSTLAAIAYNFVIDASALQQHLNVTGLRGVEEAWNKIYETLLTEKQDDGFGLVHWLDELSINYVYKECFMK